MPLTSSQVRDLIELYVNNNPLMAFQNNRMKDILLGQVDVMDALVVGAGGEPTISLGTVNQYWRGDKTWQTLNSAAVGLGNVPNINATIATNLSSGIIPSGRYGNYTIPLEALMASGTPTNDMALFYDGWRVPTIPTDAVPTDGSTNAVQSNGVFDELALKAPIASPTFTGIPAAPTATPGTNTTQLATTAFVTAAVAAATTGVASFNGRTGTVVSATNDYTWAQIDKTTSSFADITTRSAGDISSGTLADARLSGNVILSTGSYSNPAWLTALAWAKITGTPTTLSGYGITDGVTLNGSETLTNKTISGSSNTLTNIAQSSVTNLVSDLALKANIASPTFTGTPAAPTASPGTNTTQLATTAFVTAAVSAATAGVSSWGGRTGAVVPLANDYTWAQINKTVSSFADITTRSASDISSGTLAVGRLPATVVLTTGSYADPAWITSLNFATKIYSTISGTPDGTKFLKDDGTWGVVPGGNVGTVTNVSGTSNRITVTSPTSTPVIDIAATYAGQSTITTLGTVTTGVWNATAISDTYISSASTWNSKQAGNVHLTSISGLTPSNDDILQYKLGAWTNVPFPSGIVASVSGTANRITSTGGATPVIDISSAYTGQSSITTLGTIATGVWQGTAIANAYIDSVAWTKITGTPTTIAGYNISDGVTLTGTQTLTNKSLTSPTLTGTPTAPTAAPGTNTTQIASTAFVTAAVAAATSGVASFNGRTGVVVPATNDYTWAQINKTTSSLADLATRSAGELNSGILLDARLSSNVPLKDTANTFTAAITVPTEVYGVSWNGSNQVPTKDALYDILETKGDMRTDAANNMTSSGTIIFPYNTTTSQFRVGMLEIQSVMANFATFSSNLYWDGSNWKHRATDAVSDVVLGGGTVQFRVGASASAGSTATLVTPLAMSSVGLSVQLTSGYINFSASGSGSSGYGFRDNAGTMQYKNSGGSWSDFPVAGSGGTVNSGTANRLAYYSGSGTAVSELAAITASRAMVSDTNGLPTHSAVTATELGYVSGVTSSIQTQFGTKQDTLVSGTNIKTINGATVLGSGDLTITANTTSTIYVSPSGIGTGSGSTAATAVTMARLLTLSASFTGGEKILFEAGGTYAGKLTIKSNTYIGRYGDGAAPRLSGTIASTSLTWTQNGAVWSATSASRVGRLLRNGVPEKTAQSAFHTIDSNGGNTLTSSTATGVTNATAMEIISKEYAWRWTYNTVTAYNSGAGTVTLNTTNNAAVGYQFKFFNHPDLITADGDWAWVSGTVYYRSPGNVNPNTLSVDLAVYEEGVFIEEDASNIEIDGVEFYGQAIDSIYGKNISNLLVRNCSFNYPLCHGIALPGDIKSVVIDNNIVTGSGFSGISLYKAIDFKITRNTVNNTGTQTDPPFTRFTTSRYSNLYAVNSGILTSTNSAYGLVESNKVNNCAYIGIRHDGHDSVITKNRVSNHNTRANDGGGIYLNGNLGTSVTAVYDNEISNNVVWEGSGSNEGAPAGTAYAVGIYLDNGSNECIVAGNTTYDNSQFGIFSGFTTRDNEFYGNISYNNDAAQFAIYNYPSIDVNSYISDGMKVKGNQFISLASTQRCMHLLDYEAGGFNPFSDGGTANANIFVSPYTTDIIRKTVNTSAHTDYTLSGAITYYGHDFGQLDSYTDSYVSESAAKGNVPLQVNLTGASVNSIPFPNYRNPGETLFHPTVGPNQGVVYINEAYGGAGANYWTLVGSTVTRQLDQNASTNVTVKNMNAGSSAIAGYIAESDAGYLNFGMPSVAAGAFGAIAAGNGFMYSNQPFTFMTNDSSAYINFAPSSNEEAFRFYSTSSTVAYINMGGTSGSGDWGIRKNGGNVEVKHSGGSWALIGSSGSASQWDDVTGGINYASGNIGIGDTTPTHVIDAHKNHNGNTRISISNSTAGNAASTDVVVNSDAGYVQFGVNSSTTDAWGALTASVGFMYSALPLVMMCNNASGYIAFAPNTNVESFRMYSASSTEAYINMGTTSGSGGWGIRKNSGAVEYKDNGGSWIALNTLTGGGGGMSNPMTTTGDMIYSSSGSTPARLGIGSEGQYLIVSGGLPAWSTINGTVRMNSLVSALAIANTETVVVYTVIPANNLQVGSCIRVKGYCTQAGTNAATPTIRIRIGATALTGTVMAQLTGNVGTSAVSSEFEGLVTIRTTGSTGTALGGLNQNKNAVAPVANTLSSTGGINTTIENQAALTFISGNGSNTYTFQVAEIEVIHPTPLS